MLAEKCPTREGRSRRTFAASKPKDTRTEAQRAALLRLLTTLKHQYPMAVIRSNRDLAAKSCPCFDATSEYANLSNNH